MKTNQMLTAVVLAAAFATTGAVAQTEVQAPVAVPAVSPTPAPDEVIYIPRLPQPSELTSAAAAQGLAVEKMVQTGTQITVVYKYANGQFHTVAYQLLPSAGAVPATTAIPATTTVVPATTTVYYPARSYYYYDSAFDPWWYWYPAVTLGVDLGYGFHGGYRSHGWGDHDHYRGGFHSRGFRSPRGRH